MPRIVAFPAWEDNPYLNMLYLSAVSSGWSLQGTTRTDNLIRLLGTMGSGDVVHIHWTAPVCQRADSYAAARRQLDEFTEALESATAAGVDLIWTVHNVLPHELHYRDLEIELANLLVRLSAQVIQLNSHTVEAVAADYELPVDKVVTLPHSSYHGVYPNSVTRADARARLGVPSTSPTVAFVGQIRPYKGISTLLAAVGTLSDDVEDLTLLLAGKVHPDLLPDIDRQLPVGVRVVRSHGFVDDADLQLWYRAADVLVLPYDRVLNSGSALLAATFGRPCILPGEPHMVGEFGDEEWVSFFTPGAGAVASLARALHTALDGSARTGAAAETFALAYTPWQMSRDYVRILESLSAPA